MADTAAELRSGDVRDGEALVRAAEGCYGVVHLAAIAIERGANTYESVNTEATRTVIEAMRRAGVSRLVFTSQNGASLSSPSPFLRSKAIAEQLVRASGLRWTVLRPSVIFGPEDEFVNVLARMVRLSPLLFPLPGGGRARFQPVAVGDVARVVALCMERDGTVNAAYALGGPVPLSLRDMVERILVAMDARRTLVAVPIALLRPLVWLMSRLLPRPPVTPALLDLLALDNTVPDDAIRREFHFAPTPFAPEELRYLRRITTRDALRSFFG